MAVIKCKMCGGDLNFAEGASVAECEYCGSKQTIPNQDSEKKLTLFARADRLRRACEFDKAAGVYESIVADFPEEAEAYWGLVLCRYGIEYVDDPATGKKVPTCHRSSFDSILEDADFDLACENADPIARRLYRDEAKTIEDIRKGILEVSGKEEPYDIFICYKETDENGNRTIDSVIAQDVYDVLTEKGYRVFFSRISLEDKLGTEYEPYIFAALNSAKVMLAFGTDYEHFNAVWVKNEWSRFLALISAGQKKVLIPCYKNIDAYDMPKEFSKLQGQDMGKVGAIQDLLRGIDKIFNGNPAPATSSVLLERQMQAQKQAKADNTVQLGTMALNSGDIQKAVQYYEEAIKINADYVGAYIGLVRALDFEKSRPYCKRLETFPLETISEYMKQNPEMLVGQTVSLLDRAVSTLLSLEFIKILLEIGADSSNEYILYHALVSERKDKYNLIKLLLDNNINPNTEYVLKFNNTTEKCTPLRDVIWKLKDTNLAELLISYGADVNYISKSSNDESWSLLDMAVRSNNEPMVQLLLGKGANPNSGRWCISGYSNGSLKTFYCALSEAIWNVKNINIVQMLLSCGANPNYQYTSYFSGGYYSTTNGKNVCTGLYDAICSSETNEILKNEMIKILLASGANPSSTYEYMSMGNDDYGVTTTVPILAIAACKGNKNAIEMLIKAGASFDELCIRKKHNEAISAPLKKCDCRFPEEIKGTLYNKGWTGPSFFKGMYLDFRY